MVVVMVMWEQDLFIVVVIDSFVQNDERNETRNKSGREKPCGDRDEAEAGTISPNVASDSARMLGHWPCILRHSVSYQVWLLVMDAVVCASEQSIIRVWRERWWWFSQGAKMWNDESVCVAKWCYWGRTWFPCVMMCSCSNAPCPPFFSAPISLIVHRLITKKAKQQQWHWRWWQ